MTTLVTIVDEISTQLEKDITALPLGREDQQKVVNIVFTAMRTVADFLVKDNDTAIAAMQLALAALQSVPEPVPQHVTEAIVALTAQVHDGE